MRCKNLTIIPLEVIVRNIAAGSIVKTTHLMEGTIIQPPIVEFFLKDDSKNDPLLTPDRVRLMGIDIEPLIETSLNINQELQQLFLLCGIDLVDFKLEYGHDAHGNLFVADELSPDNMRLWSKSIDRDKFDKDLFRSGEGDIVEAYKNYFKETEEVCMSNSDFIWVEKYRPKTIEECILPDDTKKTFQSFLDRGEIPNMLLAGPPGIW